MDDGTGAQLCPDRGHTGTSWKDKRIWDDFGRLHFANFALSQIDFFFSPALRPAVLPATGSLPFIVVVLLDSGLE